MLSLVGLPRLFLPSNSRTWISHVFIYEWLFTWMFVCCCCNLMMFYDWCECVMNVLGTKKYSSAIVLTLGNNVILYCIVLYCNRLSVQTFRYISTPFADNAVVIVFLHWSSVIIMRCELTQLDPRSSHHLSTRWYRAAILAIICH